jgi:flagellar hook assembly protein FlgD
MLYPNYPNPFNDGTTIEYHLPLQKDVRLSIYNILGQAVKVFVDETQEPGYYEYRWDGIDDRGEKVPTGLYLLRLEAGYWILTRKMLLLQ